ncbi:hypothetical protein EGI16_12020 [Chryseobacterium sp. G0240]|nr:hypothetical protein EGI16_12020 [Chryseobacterium sp. G0240]
MTYKNFINKIYYTFNNPSFHKVFNLLKNKKHLKKSFFAVIIIHQKPPKKIRFLTIHSKQFIFINKNKQFSFYLQSVHFFPFQ